jgi:hypothetical protein
MGVIGRFVVDSFFFECIVGAAWFLLRLGSLYEGDLVDQNTCVSRSMRIYFN